MSHGLPEKVNKRHRKIVQTLSLLVRDDDVEHLYYCNDCRAPVFKYKGEVSRSDPGRAPTKTPVIHQCPNKHCKKEYLVLTFVKLKN